MIESFAVLFVAGGIAWAFLVERRLSRIEGYLRKIAGEE